MRSPSKRNEIRASKSLLKNGKLFLPPAKDGSDFKELFGRLAAAGAGRPPDRDGFPAGPWTPELLAEAISQFDTNPAGVDLRTVQLWFQENEKGVSTTNIRWLARIFGCDDPVATREWQMELIAAQARLSAKRREWRRVGSGITPGGPATAEVLPSDDGSEFPVEPVRETDAPTPRQRRSLARKSEALLSRGSPLNIPAWVFGGFTALGFLSYITGIHSVTYERADGVVKQVGFLWTANWTSVFMALLPLFFAFVAELVTFWKNEERVKLVAQGDRLVSDKAWACNVDSTSYSYWAAFSICLLFAGLFQWMGVSLLPLMKGSTDYATDWGSLAIVRPEVISVPEAVVFTGLAYLYMSVCFYLFFAGLILLYTVTNDIARIGEETSIITEHNQKHELNDTILRTMNCIFRCTVLGVLIAIVMKLQSAYLTSRGENIVSWLVDDLFSAFDGRNAASAAISQRRPTYYSSLVIALSTCFVFTYGAIHLGLNRHLRIPIWRMSAVITLLIAGYLAIGAFAGFSILLGLGVVAAVHGLLNPALSPWRVSE